MHFPSIRVIALLSGFAVAGCGAIDPKHCSGGTNCGTGGNGGSGGTGGSGGSGGTGGTGGGGGGGSDNNCGVQNFMLQKGGTPDLLIVQDRSGSMMDPATTGGTGSKWASITAAINQVVGQVNTVDWGLLFFSPVGGFGSCSVPSTPDVKCGPNTASAISTAISGTSPMGGTPTPEALNAGLQYFQGNTDGNAHYMLLATDGLPQCDTSDDSAAAEMAVTAAATAGVKTIVVGIGDDPMGATTLTAMANNGGMPDTTPGNKPYYQVNTTTDLVTVLNKIAGQIVSCTYALQMAPPNPDYVEIDDNNGMKIPRDKTHMNGWDYGPGDLSIVFYGAACDNLQKGVTTSIQAIFGCPPVG
jgi:hypothetical protein